MEKIYNFRLSCTKNRVKKAHFSRWPGWTRHFWLFCCTAYTLQYFYVFFSSLIKRLYWLCCAYLLLMQCINLLRMKFFSFFFFFFRKYLYSFWSMYCMHPLHYQKWEYSVKVVVKFLSHHYLRIVVHPYFRDFGKNVHSLQPSWSSLRSLLLLCLVSSTFRKHRLYAWVYFSKRYFFVLPYAYSVQYIIGCFILFAYD